jgi:hypothetical protein
MSLTSYRAAPPRANRKFLRLSSDAGLGAGIPAQTRTRRSGEPMRRDRWGREEGLSFAGPATTYSPGS